MSRILVIFLSLLQLVAPLVHAHTGEHDPHEGFHIPELEFYSMKDEQTVQYGAMSHFQPDGMVIDVSSGLKFNDVLPDVIGKECIGRVEKYFTDLKDPPVFIFPPYISAFSSQIFLYPSLSRAPPA